MANYQDELAFAKALATEAGKIMRRYFRAEDIGTEWKQDNTPLTVADTNINNLVIKRVKEKFPNHGVLGEEESFEPTRDLIWVVDPIDGTAPFSIGVPISTFSIALVDRKDGQPVLAVVYDPFLNHSYEATIGGGAYLNDTKLQASVTSDLAQNFVFSASIRSGKDKIYEADKLLNSIRSQKGKIVSIASFIYFGCKITTGELVGVIVDFPSTWDLVTVKLLVEEAGGIATDYNGQPQRYDDITRGLVAAPNKELHGKLLQMVQDAKP